MYPLQVEEQVKLLEKSVTHIGVGTPGRIKALIEKGKEACTYHDLTAARKNTMPASVSPDGHLVKGDLVKLLETGIMKCCQEGAVKLGLF
ncbi:hypothetical protein JZ751_023585 [Albula glossodonta]|uniref:Uncharacterized protein n=1 Tax=Albula glossodonta TaxID=121402 RepID=A0A8T2NPE9_9TELE|nr:hypothetical protein JZ751_023585 [Albula glossodonta]